MKIELITSRENKRLINARKARDGKAPGKMFVEGKRLVHEALASGVVIEEVFFSRDFDDGSLRDAFHGHVFELPDKLFSSIADTDHPQGIVITAKRPETSSLTFRSTTLPLVVYLHEINNPSNLGAVIRTSEAAGVDGIIISGNSADVFSPKALRAAMGSSFRIPVWEDAGFDDALSWAKENGLISTAADIAGDRSYLTVDWKKPRLVIFGSEARGLTDAQLESVDETITIPIASSVESLNLAVSAGVVLFEAKRQKEA